MRIPIATALATFTLCMLTETVRAQEYCVTCTGPDARYRCTIGGNPGLAGGGSRGQLLCITELARLGPHASCSVARMPSGPCEGELRTVMFPNAAPLPGEAEIQPGASVPGAQLPPPAGGVPAPGHGAPQAPWEVVPQAPGQVAPEATWEAVPQTPTEGAPQTPAEGAPRTAEEGAQPPVQSPGESLKKAGEAIGDGAKAAGNAVGNAVKKTWTCLSSFFGDC